DHKKDIVVVIAHHSIHADPLLAELRALLFGICLTIDISMKSVVFEGDCEVMVIAIRNSVDNMHWDARSLLLDCKALL
ncbi:hypothetical protein PanWU01x14_082930, partial [Parasponia andersonii]